MSKLTHDEQELYDDYPAEPIRLLLDSHLTEKDLKVLMAYLQKRESDLQSSEFAQGIDRGTDMERQRILMVVRAKAADCFNTRKDELARILRDLADEIEKAT